MVVGVRHQIILDWTFLADPREVTFFLKPSMEPRLWTRFTWEKGKVKCSYVFHMFLSHMASFGRCDVKHSVWTHGRTQQQRKWPNENTQNEKLLSELTVIWSCQIKFSTQCISAVSRALQNTILHQDFLIVWGCRHYRASHGPNRRQGHSACLPRIPKLLDRSFRCELEPESCKCKCTTVVWILLVFLFWVQ